MYISNDNKVILLCCSATNLAFQLFSLGLPSQPLVPVSFIVRHQIGMAVHNMNSVESLLKF